MMAFISSVVRGERKKKGDIKVNLLVKTGRKAHPATLPMRYKLVQPLWENNRGASDVSNRPACISEGIHV